MRGLIFPASVCLACCTCQPPGGLADRGDAGPVVQHEPWASDADPAARPSAVRNGRTITILPSRAAFAVPQEWVDWDAKFGDNFHLTREALEAAARGAGEWDTEYASVCNAALPFDRCAAHLGGEGWGRKSVSYADLQMRVYDLAESPEAVESRVEQEAASDVFRFSGRRPALTRDGKGDWRRVTASFERWYGDYGATANVDFRLRRCDDRTFVFVFMYSSYRPQEQMIIQILDSFAAE